MSPLVSVIIPNYNHASYLRERIVSVLCQTYTNTEVIILDDASNDSSVSVIDEFNNHPKVSKIVLNEANSGSTFLQWVIGMKETQGDYVWIAESDDYSDPLFLNRCMEKLESDQTLTLAFCDTVPVDKEGRPLLIRKNQAYSGKYNAIDDKFFYNWFYLNDPFRILNASSCVFRKSLVDSEALQECSKFKFAGDKFFWFNLLSRNPLFYYIAEPLNYQRYHDTTTRARRGILWEYQRNQELSIIYDNYRKQHFQLDKPAYKEIGERIVATNLYGIILFKLPNLVRMFKGLVMVGIDIKFYKRILKTILNDKRHLNLRLYRSASTGKTTYIRGF
jgi:glycosyltransferase involved in cell wall biosynthesis